MPTKKELFKRLEQLEQLFGSACIITANAIKDIDEKLKKHDELIENI